LSSIHTVTSILTFNAGMIDIRTLGIPVYRPLPRVSERLRRLPDALAALDADIVCLQELYQRRQQNWLRAELANRYPYAAGMPVGGVRLGSDLMVLSKYPITATRSLRFEVAMTEESLFTDRGFQLVDLELPGAGPIRLINLHASAGGLFRHPEGVAAAAIRTRQIDQVLQSVGEGPVILAGDFNAGSEASPVHYRTVLDAGYRDAFAAADGEGATWDPRNPLVAGGKEHHLQAQRIDHVFLNHAAAAKLRPADARIVLDGSPPLSDHFGVLVEFEANA
jgi:endonuclease/exonuclease/phosphatase family metal-dependent hydrolase